MSAASAQPASQDPEQAVRALVVKFGGELKNVSLLAPSDTVKASMQEHYGDLVTADLLSQWEQDPQHAPGRLTSSPWPDRSDITSVTRQSDTAYEVKGDIIEITSQEATHGGVAAKQPITLTVTQVNGAWRISGVTLGTVSSAQPQSVVYVNEQYGFRFPLPDSWKGYKIVTTTWEGLAINSGSNGDQVVDKGPILSIRHPQWTEAKPRQDIPIMVFTTAQWKALQDGKFHIGAAPIGPSELGHNSKYVFALPARYNYAFPEGYKEVEQILSTHPLEAMEPSK